MVNGYGFFLESLGQKIKSVDVRIHESRENVLKELEVPDLEEQYALCGQKRSKSAGGILRPGG